MEKLVHTLLDYMATYPNDGIVYRASDMVLCAHADAGYLNETKSRSRAGHTSTFRKMIQFPVSMVQS